MTNALNQFIEDHIELDRDASGSVKRTRGVARMTEDGMIQMNQYLGSCLSDCLDEIRRGGRGSTRVQIAVREMLEAYDAGGLDAVLALRQRQHDARNERQLRVNAPPVRRRHRLNELRERRAA